MIIKKIAKLPWWQIALIAIAISAIGGLTTRQSSKNETDLYTKELRQAPWAPPAWLFGPAWTTINIFLLLALQRLLQSNIPAKKKLIILQAFIWMVFFTFGYVYFNRKSPVLAAVWTMSDAALAAASFIISYKADKKLSYYYLPLLLWTVFASTVAGYQALNNPDPVVGIRY
jgi:tryptophan-rich sensory protein